MTKLKTKLNVILISHTPDPESVVAAAAKLCYSESSIEELITKQTETDNSRFIEKLISIGHESPIEHVNFTFAVEGVSRTLTHQLVRHRIASYSQVSQRYVDQTQFEYITPPAISTNEKAIEQYGKAMHNAQKSYDIIVGLLFNDLLIKHIPKILENDNKTNYFHHGADYFHSKLRAEIVKFENKLYKVAMEDARYVLPNATETKIMFTMNARTLLNFFELRCCNRAQWEIRQLADEMIGLVREAAPTIFAKAGASCTRGKCNEGDMTCGSPRR